METNANVISGISYMVFLLPVDEFVKNTLLLLIMYLESSLCQLYLISVVLV